MNAVLSALGGIQGAFARLDASAARTVRPIDAVSGPDYAREAVERITARTELKANVAVVRTAYDMLGAVLDVKA